MRETVVAFCLLVTGLLSGCAHGPGTTRPEEVAEPSVRRHEASVQAEAEILSAERTARHKAPQSRRSMWRSDDFAPLPPKSEDEIRIHFVSIGAGACQVIECPGVDATPLVVDCGSTSPNTTRGLRDSEAIRYVQETLAGRGANVVVSHPDKDHYAYLPRAVPANKVQTLWMGGEFTAYPDDVRNWAAQVDARSTASLQRLFADLPQNWHNAGEAVESLQCGEALTFVLTTNNGSTSNDQSLVLSVDHGEFRSIFPGDATNASQDAALGNFPGDLLVSSLVVASHHGAVTHGSNSDAWVAATQPLYVIYSAGSSYFHPRCDAIDTFRAGDTLLPAESHGFRCGDGSAWRSGPSDAAEFNTHSSGVIVVTSDAFLSNTSVICRPGPC